jgi:colanic acid biosynthesis glycosyl transferase WcaI
MRILFFSDHFRPEPSAPAAHVYERAARWVSQGHEVTVMTAAPNFPIGEVYPGYRNRPRAVEWMAGIRVVRCGTYVAENRGMIRRTLDYASYAVSAFANALFEARPDVVISSSPHLFVPVAGVAYARLKGVPHVMEVRDLWPASIAATTRLGRGKAYEMLEALELALYAWSARILALTPAFRPDLMARGVPGSKIDVVINGANTELFSPRPRDASIVARYGLEGRFVVGYLGTMGLAHGLENVVHAAELLRDTNVTFFFVGVGAAKAALESEVTSRGLSNVVFAPRQEREVMPAFWSACDVGLVHLRDDPVFSSALPSKVFESMAMGIPVLYVGPESAGAALVRERGTGVSVPAASPEKFAEAILTLRDDRALWERCHRSAAANAPEFSRDRQADATLAVLERALASGVV